MKYKKIAITVFAAMCAAFVTGCSPTARGGDTRASSAPGVEWGSFSEAPRTTSGEVSAPSSSAFVIETPTYSISESLPEDEVYRLSEEEEEMCGESLFVGDSICLGFSAYGVVDPKNVYATISVAVRNMFEFRMYYMEEPAEFVPVLLETQPKRVFLSMGMNDLNISTPVEFCSDYKWIISTALFNSEAEIYVCAITPINAPEYASPAEIDEFNDALKSFIENNYFGRVHFVSFAEPLKDDNGLLNDLYGSGDGIHLGQRAYYVAVHELYRQVKAVEDGALR